jgi:hypothetical protein
MVVKSINKIANNLKKQLEAIFKAKRSRVMCSFLKNDMTTADVSLLLPIIAPLSLSVFYKSLISRRKKFEQRQNAVFSALYGFSPSQLLYFQKVKIPLKII